MGIADLLKKGWVFGPLWDHQRYGAGDPTHYGAFLTWESALYRQMDAVCMAETLNAAVTAASALQAKLEAMRSLFDATLNVGLVDHGMLIFVITRVGQAADATVYALKDYDGGAALPEPLGTGNVGWIIDKTIRASEG
jgi:hypothetical protein